MPENPDESPLAPLVYDWQILARKTFAPLIVSALVLGLAKFGIIGPEAKEIANAAGELVVVVVLALVSRADWVGYIGNLTKTQDERGE
jgi:hypothetical protein